VTKRAFDNGFVHCRSASVRNPDGFGDRAARTDRLLAAAVMAITKCRPRGSKRKSCDAHHGSPQTFG
jgi:hypothetical protein